MMNITDNAVSWPDDDYSPEMMAAMIAIANGAREAFAGNYRLRDLGEVGKDHTLDGIEPA